MEGFMWKGSTCFFVQYQIHVLSVYFQYQEQVNSFKKEIDILKDANEKLLSRYVDIKSYGYV